MFPIGDDNTGITRPALATIAIIMANIAVFVFLQAFGNNQEFTYAFAAVPREILSGQDVARAVTISDPITTEPIGKLLLQPTPIPVYLTLLTSMFMHSGFGHIFGNMLFLWIFGDNVEQAMGSGRFILFYLVCGIIAGLSHVFLTVMTGGNQFVPMLGASGAISGVLAGYLVLFPSRRVRVLVMRMITEVPAALAIGLWFVFQLVSGMGILGNDSQVGGVAYAAHIGGFIAGLLLVKLFAGAQPAAATVEQRAYESSKF